MSFLSYIRAQRADSDAAGDFIRDAQRDPEMPNAQSWDELHDYLFDCGASDNAIEAARIVWQRYQTKLGQD